MNKKDEKEIYRLSLEAVYTLKNLDFNTKDFHEEVQSVIYKTYIYGKESTKR